MDSARGDEPPQLVFSIRIIAMFDTTGMPMAWQKFLGQFGRGSIEEPAEKDSRGEDNLSGPGLPRALLHRKPKSGEGVMSERLTPCHETDARRCKIETLLFLRQGYNSVILGK